MLEVLITTKQKTKESQSDANKVLRAELWERLKAVEDKAAESLLVHQAALEAAQNKYLELFAQFTELKARADILEEDLRDCERRLRDCGCVKE